MLETRMDLRDLAVFVHFVAFCELLFPG